MYENISIQVQYQNTNIEQLLNGIVEVRKKNIKLAIDIFKQCIDLKTSSGLALDMWGRLLNFSRFIPIDSGVAESFRNFNFYNKNFQLLKFWNRKDVAYAELSDYAYRQVLTLLWQSRNIKANVYNAGELAEVVFNSVINVGDSMNMSFIVYYFRDEVPAWLKYILDNYDILPRPACVGSQAVSALARIFGFQTDDIEYNRKITAFYNSIFMHGFFDGVGGERLNGLENYRNKSWLDRKFEGITPLNAEIVDDLPAQNLNAIGADSDSNLQNDSGKIDNDNQNLNDVDSGAVDGAAQTQDNKITI